MNGLERVVATLGGQPVDGRAFAPVLSLYGARLTGARLREYFTDAATFARGQAAVRERFGPDVLFGPFEFAGIGEAFGSEVRWFDDQPPNVRRPAVSGAARWPEVALPDPDRHPRLVFLREVTARLAAEHGAQVALAVPLPAPADLPALVLGLDAWLEALLFEPDLARRVLDDVVPFFVRLANGIFAAGATFVVLPTALTSPRMSTRELASRAPIPALVAALGQLRGPAVLHHVGTPMLGTLDLLASIPNAIGFALDEADDPVRAREIVGPTRVLLTGPSGPGLTAGSPQATEARCRALLERVRGDRHLALYTSAADVPLDTPPEHLDGLRRAARAVAGGAP